MDHALENLGPERFQHLCQALLVKEFPNVICLPIGQPDGGRDALQHILDGGEHTLTVFQVKYARQPPARKDTQNWVLDAVDGEVEKVKRLKERGAKNYVLIMNVSGTAHLDVGSIDRIQEEVSLRLPIPAICWWRDDLNRRLDGSWDLKLRYPEILSGQDFLRLLLETSGGQEESRRRRAINTFLSEQYSDDQEVKFKQVELQNKLLDLFVDLPFRLITRLPSSQTNTSLSASFPLRIYPEGPQGAIVAESMPNNPEKDGTATFLLHELGSNLLEQIVVEGAPGQGKSTLVQYICQVHRIRWLNKSEDLDRLPGHHKATPLRIPFKVDLRDLATWLSGFDPFSDRQDRVTEPRTLETFLVRLVRHHGGGVAFDVNDLHEVSRVAPLLVTLDGLDEVADIKGRADVVTAVTKAIGRLRENCAGLRVVITSRPAAFANSPGFDTEQFPHLHLGSVRRHQIELYAQRWMDARNLQARERMEFSSILNEKMDQPHLRDLARNPMQLAILLSLIHTRGAALPDRRTNLYDAYVDLFFSREAAKSTVVRKHIDLLKDIHRYLAWVLHTAAESGKRNSGGRISQGQLQSILQAYLQREQHKTFVLEEIFGAMLERVVMIVSRVQGTYEFEVQPLREYFAARHLYDTASYSPTGGERGGTKPDRFDAIARDFYWLNVTRFFCGCFSEGELLDLAERVKALIDDPILGRTRHPAMLGAMLLADWVFSQTPKAVVELVTSLAMPDALRRLLPGDTRFRSDQVVQLPETCGGPEIVSNAFDLLQDPQTQADLARHLAAYICANTDPELVDEKWLLIGRHGTDIVKWLRMGSDLGSLARVKQSEILDIINIPIVDKKCRELLCHAGRFDVLIRSDGNALETIGTLLAMSNGFSSEERWGLAPLYLLPMFLALGPDLTFGRGQYLFDSVNEAIERFNSGPRAAKAEELSFEMDVERQAFDLSCKIANVLDLKDAPNVVTVPPAEIERLLEDFRANWGDTFSIISIANAICYLPTRGGSRTKSSNLFSRDRPLCDRIRTAKSRAKNVAWWRTQIGAMNTATERFLFHLTFWTWAPIGICFEMTGELATLLDALERDEWLRLLDFLRLPLDRSMLKVGASGAKVLPPSPLPSNRLALLIGLKDRTSYGRAIFLRYLSDCGDGSPTMAAFRQVQSFEAAMAGAFDWRPALNVIRATYAEGSAYPLYIISSSSKLQLILPDSVSQQVLADATKYPVSLWTIAEATASANSRKTVRAVGQVAKEERWFEY